MRNLIDTNVWIDAIAGNLSKKAFLKISVKAEWAGYSAITRLELFGFPGLTESDEGKIRELLHAFEEVAVTSGIIDRAIEIRRKAKVKGRLLWFSGATSLQETWRILRGLTA
jgi:predicted nucleic acid-binding protein